MILTKHPTIQNLLSKARRIAAVILEDAEEFKEKGGTLGTRVSASDRKSEMLKAYREGASLRAVGERFDISGSRVQQILKSMPDYQGARDAARSVRRKNPDIPRKAEQLTGFGSQASQLARSPKQSWKDLSEHDDTFENLYQMRAAGKKWKDLAEAAGRPGDRSNAHSTMLHMKRQSKARGRRWPIRPVGAPDQSLGAAVLAEGPETGKPEPAQ